ncbi:MAG: acetoacetate decarboxylase family protein [Chloroflexaceae bacterium]
MNQKPDTPLRLEHTLFVNAAYPMPAGNARKLLPKGVKVNLVEGFPGQALLIVAFALYRQTPFGPFAEATLALLATHERAIPIATLTQLLNERRYPAYVLHMLVSNAEAQQHGVANWSLPRQLADVRVIEVDGQAVCEAQLEGQSLVQLVATRPNTDRSRDMQIETYSQDQQGLLHTVMRCNAEAYGRTQGGGGILIWGEHPLGKRLASMGVKSQPLMVRYYDQMLAELHPPQVVR